jgi:hypothetical protein
MTDYIAQAKLPLKLIDVTVGRANPPDSIKSQRIETLHAHHAWRLACGQRRIEVTPDTATNAVPRCSISSDTS